MLDQIRGKPREVNYRGALKYTDKVLGGNSWGFLDWESRTFEGYEKTSGNLHFIETSN